MKVKLGTEAKTDRIGRRTTARLRGKNERGTGRGSFLETEHITRLRLYVVFEFLLLQGRIWHCIIATTTYRYIYVPSFFVRIFSFRSVVNMIHEQAEATIMPLSPVSIPSICIMRRTRLLENSSNTARVYKIRKIFDYCFLFRRTLIKQNPADDNTMRKETNMLWNMRATVTE